MENKVEIKTVNIKVGKKELSLTVEECKKLKSLLDELFGKEIVKEVTEIHHTYPYRWYWDYMPAPAFPMPLTPIYYCQNNGTANLQDNVLNLTCDNTV
jgi:hypothetical protein